MAPRWLVRKWSCYWGTPKKSRGKKYPKHGFEMNLLATCRWCHDTFSLEIKNIFTINCKVLLFENSLNEMNLRYRAFHALRKLGNRSFKMIPGFCRHLGTKKPHFYIQKEKVQERLPFEVWGGYVLSLYFFFKTIKSAVLADPIVWKQNKSDIMVPKSSCWPAHAHFALTFFASHVVQHWAGLHIYKNMHTSYES